jgi:hypothetical protein
MAGGKPNSSGTGFPPLTLGKILACHGKGPGIFRAKVLDEALMDGMRAHARLKNMESLNTSLMKACTEGNEAEAAKLLKEGASPDYQNRAGRSPLMCAAACGSGEVVELLLAKGANPNLADAHGDTALMLASGCGRIYAAKLLLGMGADPNRTNADRATALMMAAGEGSEGLVKLLVKEGAQPHAKDATGRTARAWAEKNGHVAVSEYLKVLETPSAEEQARLDAELLRAAASGPASAVEEVLKMGANVETRAKNGWTDRKSVV